MCKEDEVLLKEIAKMIYFDFEEYEVGSVAEVTWRENKRRQEQYKERVKPILALMKEGGWVSPVEHKEALSRELEAGYRLAVNYSNLEVDNE